VAAGCRTGATGSRARRRLDSISGAPSREGASAGEGPPPTTLTPRNAPPSRRRPTAMPSPGVISVGVDARRPSPLFGAGVEAHRAPWGGSRKGGAESGWREDTSRDRVPGSGLVAPPSIPVTTSPEPRRQSAALGKGGAAVTRERWRGGWGAACWISWRGGVRPT
jgi:hypothetical protein